MVRALWMFLIIPATALGLLSLFLPGVARVATTVLAPLLVIAAAAWMNGYEEPAVHAAPRSRAQRTLLFILVGAFLIALLFMKLYS